MCLLKMQILTRTLTEDLALPENVSVASRLAVSCHPSLWECLTHHVGFNFGWCCKWGLCEVEVVEMLVPNCLLRSDEGAVTAGLGAPERMD